MAQDDGTPNLNRAICNAVGDAERADQKPAVPVEKDRTMMQAIYLNDYVKVNKHLYYSSKHKDE